VTSHCHPGADERLLPMVSDTCGISVPTARRCRPMAMIEVIGVEPLSGDLPPNGATSFKVDRPCPDHLHLCRPFDSSL